MSQQVKKAQQTLQWDDYVELWVESFLKERKAQNLTKGTLRYYRMNLEVFRVILGGSEEVSPLGQMPLYSLS